MKQVSEQKIVRLRQIYDGSDVREYVPREWRGVAWVETGSEARGGRGLMSEARPQRLRSWAPRAATW